VVLRLKTLKSRQQALRVEGERHLNVIEPVLAQVSRHAKEIEELEATREVILVLLNVEQASESIKRRIGHGEFTNEVLVDCLDKYRQLLDIRGLAAGNRAYPEAVAKYAETHTREAFLLLEEHLARKFNSALERILWPTPKEKLTPAQWSDENISIFKKTFADLVTLQNPSDFLFFCPFSPPQFIFFWSPF